MIGRIYPGVESSCPSKGNISPAGDQLWASALEKAKKSSTTGAQHDPKQYAFDGAGSSLRIDPANPATTAERQWGKWLKGAARLAGRFAVGFAVTEGLERIAGPPPLIRGDYALAPDLSIRVWGEGHNGPNGETALFLRKNTNLGQGEDAVLPVHVERTQVPSPFTGTELRQYRTVEALSPSASKCRPPT